MPIPLLPSLKESNKIAITKRGEWMSDAQTNLGNLADDLKVTAGVKSDISSIPDLWARPSMYELVLYDENHHLHKRFLDEWRGVLAILALREMRTLGGVAVNTVEIPPETQLQENAPMFLKVITKNLPEEYKRFPDKTIEHGYKLHVISYENMPLAVVWPTILVCPSVELYASSIKPVSWWKIDGLHDPISSLNDQEKSVLYDWLEMVKNEINRDNIALTNKKISDLIGLIYAFQKDLKVSGISNNQYIAGTSLDITGFCECLGRANMIDVGESSFLAKSNVMLSNRRNTKDSKNKPKALLVMTRDMYTQWNMSASDIIVGGAYSLDAVLPKYTGVIADKTKIGNFDLNQFNAELCMGEDFFTDKICIVFSGDEVFPNAVRNFVKSYNGSQVNILLPVKEELLNYLDEDYLASHSNIEIDGTSIVVELKLPLSGFSKEGKQLVVKKTYRQSNGNDNLNEICYIGSLPMIQVWPNFVLENGKESNWQAYYSFYDNLNRQTFYAKPYWDENTIVKRELQLGGRAEIIKGTSFPLSFICSAEQDTDNGPMSYPVGVILLKKPQQVQYNVPNKKAKIGIDFGTTNTVAYMSIDGDTPNILTLHNYNEEDYNNSMLYDVTVNDDPVCREEGRRNFIAMSDQPQKPATSIRTIYHTHRGSMVNGIGATPLLLGNIYYLDDADSVLDDKNILGSLQTEEMKWDLNGINNMEGFLLELGMQCMAEAVKAGVTEIEWAYSYPTSFTLNHVQRLGNLWRNNLNQFRDISSLVSDNLSNRTESIAMATFFANQMNAHIIKGVVCLDIGGGSTDIAVWQGTTMSTADVRYQASLRFAGKEILNRQLFNNKSVINNLSTNDPEVNKHIEALVAENKEKEFNLLLEAFLKYNEDKIFHALTAASTLDNVNVLRRNVVYALSGIFFYTGIVIGYLRVNEKYGEFELLPDCYVGGNGSKLLNWAAAGIFDSNNLINQIFKACLTYGIDIGQYLEKENHINNGKSVNEEKLSKYDPVFDIKCTSFPKQEVAYGLVCDRVIQVKTAGQSGNGIAGASTIANPFNKAQQNAKTNNNATEKTIIAGEDFVLDGVLKNGLEELLPEYILGKIKVSRDFRVFKAFLSKFNEQATALSLPEIILGKQDLNNIWAAVNQELIEKNKDSGGSPNNVEVEPLFIMILRNTLRMI